MAYDRTKDPGANRRSVVSAVQADTPARRAAAVTPHNSNDLDLYAKALFIGVGGDVAVIPVNNADDAPIVFKNCASGSILPVQARRVRVTGTTATNIVALYD